MPASGYTISSVGEPCHNASMGGTSADRLVIFLNTPGGSAETVEKMVEVVRYHYGEVFFVVPDYAMSAGTIFCTSGDKIFMDYSSALGRLPSAILGRLAEIIWIYSRAWLTLGIFEPAALNGEPVLVSCPRDSCT